MFEFFEQVVDQCEGVIVGLFGYVECDQFDFEVLVLESVVFGGGLFDIVFGDGDFDFGVVWDVMEEVE